MHRRLVLASRSPGRAALAATLAEALALRLEIRHGDVDERALEASLGSTDPGVLAQRLAIAKAEAVAATLADAPAPEQAPGAEPQEPESVRVLGADQLLVVERDGTSVLLHQPTSIEEAVGQLVGLAGTTHQLVNGLAVIDPATWDRSVALDVQIVTMHAFDRPTAQAYVETFRPLGCVGAYRLEDDAGLVADIRGEHPSGVLGLPLPTTGRLLTELGWLDAGPAATELSQSRRWTATKRW